MNKDQFIKVFVKRWQHKAGLGNPVAGCQLSIVAEKIWKDLTQIDLGVVDNKT